MPKEDKYQNSKRKGDANLCSVTNSIPVLELQGPPKPSDHKGRTSKEEKEKGILHSLAR